MSAWTTCALGRSRVAAKAVSTAALKSTPITSRAPHCAASWVCRPLPQPPSSTTLSLKNSGVTGAIQPRNCCSYLSSVWVKCCHCQPKPAAVAAFAASTSSSAANRGTPRTMGQEHEQATQASWPSMISSTSRLSDDKEIVRAHDGHERYCSSRSFKRTYYRTTAWHAHLDPWSQYHLRERVYQWSTLHLTKGPTRSR